LVEILLSYEVGINLFVQSILFILLSVAFVNTAFILKNYNQNATTQLQYTLEKRSYLILSIIKISLIIKIILLPFFTYTLDELSNIIPGAMCAAGVISANPYGEPLIVLKIFLVILTMLWLTLNTQDLLSKGFQYFRAKMWFFEFLYILAILELLLELLFFTNLTTLNPVSCCSTLYGSAEALNPLPFQISILELIITFYITYIALMISAYFKKRYFLLIFSLFFAYLSYYSIVYFFSTYIYQLPTHKCPYCLLQQEYYSIGYLIYGSLIIALFYSFKVIIFKFSKNDFHYVILFYSLFLFFVSLNFLMYLIVNRTLL